MKFYVVALLLINALVGTSAVNDFLKSKWVAWYNSVDVNHDGTVNRADMEKAKNKFLELINSDADTKAVLFEDWWNTYIFREETGDVSEGQFVDALSNEYTADKAAFTGKMQTCFSNIFNLLDIDEDGSFSIREYIQCFVDYGHVSNVEELKKVFKAYKPKKGLIPVEAVAASWADLVTNPESSDPSLVKDELEAGV